jgi:hypothetical protein
MLKIKPKKPNPVIELVNKIVSHDLFKIIFPVTVTGLILIFGILIIGSFVELNRIASTLMDENGKNRETMDKVTQTLRSLTQHSNEVRIQLGLSEKTYPINDTTAEAKEQQEQDKNLAYFLAIDKIDKIYS